jgi:hypothetical protein
MGGRGPKRDRPLLVQDKNYSTPRTRKSSSNVCDNDGTGNSSPEPLSKRQKLSYSSDNKETDITGSNIGSSKVKEVDTTKSNNKNNKGKSFGMCIDAGDKWTDDEESEEEVEEVVLNESNATPDTPLSDTSMKKSGRKKQLINLSPAEITTLSAFVRRTVFRRMKFLNDALMMKLLPEIYELFQITNDQESKMKKTNEIIKQTKEILSSRRGYSTLAVYEKLRGKFIDKSFIILYTYELTGCIQIKS